MNKYRIGIWKVDVMASPVAKYDAYATSAAHAAMLATTLHGDLDAVGDELKLDVSLSRVNLKRAHASCKRVQ